MRRSLFLAGPAGPTITPNGWASTVDWVPKDAKIREWGHRPHTGRALPSSAH
jgi:hypothetical protein